MELQGNQPRMWVEYLSNAACMHGQRAQVDTKLGTGFPLVDGIAAGEGAVELIDWATKVMEVPKLGHDVHVTEKVHRGHSILATWRQIINFGGSA